MNRELDRGELQDRLPDLVHGTLPEAERVVVEAAIAADLELASELDAVRLSRAALTPRVAAIDANRVMAAIRRPAPRRFAGVARWRVAAAIGWLLVGGASLTVVQRTFHNGAADSLVVVGESTAVAGARGLSVSFGYDLSELPAADLDRLIADLEKSGGVPSAEPHKSVVVPPGEEPE
jgi:hypothetical protein